MRPQDEGLARGDLVEVKTPDEITRTLDTHGALHDLPFMPEMLEYCGQRFRVSRRASTLCFSGTGSPRGFKVDDVVTLENVRCSGAAHGGCQKACVILWREAWLRNVTEAEPRPEVPMRGLAQLRARAKVSAGPRTFYCQASELSKATYSLSRRERLARHVGGLLAGNLNVVQAVRGLGTWLFWSVRRKLLGVHARGAGASEAADSLDLKPGEWVQVKSLAKIAETLDERGHNRGLYFSPDMRRWCGRRCRVEGRLDKIIVDGTGRMRQLRNTVRLEGSTCGCAYMGFGMAGCARCEVTYWREAWLSPSDAGRVHST